MFPIENIAFIKMSHEKVKNVERAFLGYNKQCVENTILSEEKQNKKVFGLLDFFF